MDPLTKKQWKRYEKATRCHICYRLFNSKDLRYNKIRDHCHYTGRYRGAAHSLCNLRYRIPSYIPLAFHNLSAHLFIKELGKDLRDMEVIAKDKEDYISFSVRVPVDSFIDEEGQEKEKLMELRFIDSFKFMASNLDSLTKNLVSGGKKLFGFEDYSDLQYHMLTRKGIYPYEYMSSWDRFKESGDSH